MKKLIQYGSPFVLVLLGAGCSSIPKDAPDDFRSADQEIKAAKSEDADNVFPKTIKSAESTLKEANKDWKKSHKASDEAGERQAALEKARRAGSMAHEAREANNRVHSWDENINSYTADMTQPAAPVAAAESTTPAVEDLVFTRTVAYFDTDKANLGADGQKDVESLADLLAKEPKMVVTLTGRADVRGGDAYNKALGERRAAAVAKELAAHGVAAERVKVVSAGKANAPTDVSDASKLQLQRRVDVDIQTQVAH